MASIQLRGGQKHTVKPETGINTTRAAPSTIARSQFISGFLLAGGTGIEPATCGFGGRGAPSRPFSRRLTPALCQRSLSVSVSLRLIPSLGRAVRIAVTTIFRTPATTSSIGGLDGRLERHRWSREPHDYLDTAGHMQRKPVGTADKAALTLCLRAD